MCAFSSALALKAPNIFRAFDANFSATKFAESVVVAGLIKRAVFGVCADESASAIKTVFVVFTLITVNSAARLAESTFTVLVVSAVI